MEILPVKNNLGKIFGYIKIDKNGDKVATDYTGKILGYYKKNLNITTDYTGKILFRGDMVSSLIKVN